MEEVEQKEEKFKKISWQKFFKNISTPFNGECFVLLRMTKGSISVMGAATTVENLEFIEEKTKPISYTG